ncbi:MAG: PaaI family thioesterase [Sphaerobacter sp.]|nr:PaaI family thioesterase [Sphaerobacter sp.]
MEPQRVNTTTDHGCFGCGEGNPIGLRLAFYRHGERGVRAVFTPQREHEGYHGVTHGGILSTLLDEAMSWAVLSDGRLAVTARMDVHFRRPVPVGQPVEVVAEVVRDRGRLVETRGEIRDEAGRVLVSATGAFARVSEAQQREWEAVYLKNGTSS